MPYLGEKVPANFQSVPAVQRFNGDGSDTTFTLNTTVSSVQDVLVSVDGVIQDSAAYTIPDGVTLTFTAAPSSGTGNIFVNYNAPQAGTITPAAENKGNFKAGGLFRTNAQSLTADTTILATENANVTGPFTVASGVTLTVESGGTLVTI
tara:strand:- start:278 stop:727 length:450 start_codon:yes stop_codon:yes gene_type:complete